MEDTMRWLDFHVATCVWKRYLEFQRYQIIVYSYRTHRIKIHVPLSFTIALPFYSLFSSPTKDLDP